MKKNIFLVILVFSLTIISAYQIPFADPQQGILEYSDRISFNGEKITIGDGGFSGSSESKLEIDYLVDDSGTGNAHAFSDVSHISRGGKISYNSFDGRVTFEGTNNYGHYAAFQSAPVYNSSGKLDYLYNFITVPHVLNGIIQNNYGFTLLDPVVNGGFIKNNYGLYIPQLNAGQNNYAIYTEGTTPSIFNGKLILYDRLGIGTSSPDKQLEVKTPKGTATEFRLRQSGKNYWDFKIPAGGIDLVLGDVSGDYVTFHNKGDVTIEGDITANNINLNEKIQELEERIAELEERL